MKKNLFIFYLTQEWKYCNRRPMILELAKALPESDFLCINRPADLIVGLFKNRYRIREALDPKKRYQKETENVAVLRPVYICHEQLAGKIGNLLNGKLLKFQMGKLSWSLENYVRIVQWIYCPLFYPITRSFDIRSNLIFEIYDEITLTPWDSVDKKVFQAEPPLLENADLIFTLTERIKENRRLYQKKISVIGNGVEFNLFSKALIWKDRPVDMLNIPRPIIGLMGNIRNWIDFAMYKEIIAAKHEWSFVIIGPIENNILSTVHDLQSPNLFILGNKAKKELFKYLAFIDVGIIPYLQSEFIKSSRPLKMLEFMAAGVPVVTVPVDVGSQTELDGALYFAHSSKEFIEKIGCLLEMEKQTVISRCQAFAERNQWSEIVNHVVKIMDQTWS